MNNNDINNENNIFALFMTRFAFEKSQSAAVIKKTEEQQGAPLKQVKYELTSSFLIPNKVP